MNSALGSDPCHLWGLGSGFLRGRLPPLDTFALEQVKQQLWANAPRSALQPYFFFSSLLIRSPLFLLIYLSVWPSTANIDNFSQRKWQLGCCLFPTTSSASESRSDFLLAERGYSQLAVIPGQLQGSRGLQGWSLTAAFLSCSAVMLVINICQTWTLKGHAHFFLPPHAYIRHSLESVFLILVLFHLFFFCFVLSTIFWE